MLKRFFFKLINVKTRIMSDKKIKIEIVQWHIEEILVEYIF